jgi:F0F1-type ATP synthase membrane subunit a
MEFSYRISEAEYLQAAKLKLKGGSRARFLKLLLFWSLVVCLAVFFSVYHKSKQTSEVPAVQQESAEAVGSDPLANRLVENVLPFTVLAGVWIFIMFKWMPMRLQRVYRKDPSMQGQYTVSVTPESVATQNTAGTSSKTGWNIYNYWREGKDVILLVFHSGSYFLLSVRELPDAQRDELRGILTAALPKK